MSQTQLKANYGVDAPGVIRNLFLAGIAVFIVSFLFPIIKLGPVIIEMHGLFWAAGGFILGGLLMLAYSLFGKFKHRDRMLNYVEWHGNEQVLDVGTGKGLLMIGAAKKLTTGKATGIDIWNAEDLSGNNLQNGINNAIAEGVADKIQILNENAMSMSFADNTFDVIVTNQVLHNIYNKEGRKKACSEIARVLKPGGVAVISDYKHVKQYRDKFKELGFETRIHPADYLTTFPALDILEVYK
ncbi:class I SAM-dependent methyltransferase [Mucilaginibacter sp. AW1-3]